MRRGVDLLVCGAVAGGATVAVVRARGELRATTARLRIAAHRAATAEAAERVARAQVHDLTASVAGVAAASRLLATGDASAVDRRRLALLLEDELERLDRLVSPEREVPTTTVRLGEVLERVVRMHRQLGHLVMWAGADATVLANPDDLTRIVLGLLSNAHRHAPGSSVCITSAVLGGRIEVRVADRGPGVDAAVRDQLFAWESRGAGSPGEGIGLHIARDLARGLGGDLTYQDGRRDRGATFVLTLPLAPASAGAGSPVPLSGRPAKPEPAMRPRQRPGIAS